MVTKKHIRLTFFMLTDLRTGRGTENVLFNLLRYIPKNIDVTIIETDHVVQERISLDEVKKLTAGCNIIRIHKHPYRKGKMLRGVFVDSILGPRYKDLKCAKSSGLLPEIRKTDIVYLFLNEYSIFFKGVDIPVIGSCHTFSINYFVNPKNLLDRVYARYLHWLYFKSINGFHYFPQYNSIFNKFKDKWHLKYNFSLPNGINTGIFYPNYNKQNKKLKFLFVAALEYSKGLDILIPLMKKMESNKDIEFHIVGTGPVEDKVKEIGNVKYHGVLTNKELAKLYRGCDIFIYPSHSDTYSLVTLQALSSGLYVLTGNFFNGIFDDFNKYLEYLPMNVDAFYNRINEIIKDRKIIEHNKKEEYEYVKNNYDWEIVAKKFYDNIREIVNLYYKNNYSVHKDKATLEHY